MASAASMERRWGFLAPWCLELKDRFELSRTEDAWGDGKGSFKLIRCVEGHFTSSVQKLREAFALLAAVQHFDTDAWTFLLSRYCQIKLEMTDDILPRVVVEMNMRETSSEEIDVLSSNLEQFCGTQQREQPSLNYVQTLAVIASMDNTMSAEKPGLDINIPIRVYVEDTMPPLLTELEGVAVDAAQTAVMSEIMTQEAVEGLTGALKRIGAVTKQVQGQWESYGSDLGVLPGSTRCTFVLEPTSLKFHGYGMTSKMMKRMHSSVLRDVPFSQMDLAVGVYKYTMDDQNVARKELGALMARMFNCGEPATDDVAKPQSHVGHNKQPLSKVHLELEVSDYGTARACDFEAICSAMASNQSVKNVSLGSWLGMRNEHFDRKNWWKWVAYGLFSKRALSCAGLESVTLSAIGSITIEDMEEFSAIVESDHPEEVMFGCPRGQVVDRDAFLKPGSEIRWPYDGQENLPQGKNEPTSLLKFESSVSSVRVFSDDDRSHWVSVMIPGYGRCQVQRDDLLFVPDTAMPQSSRLMSLTINLQASYGSNLDGLPHFMSAVGPSLKSLTIIGGRDLINENAILRCCPNMQELSFCKGLVHVQFNFDGSSTNPRQLPDLSTNWNDPGALMAQLSDPDSIITKCLRWLRIYISPETIIGGSIGRDRRNDEADLNALLVMLEKNKKLEYLDVIAPVKFQGYLDQFKKHHLEPIERALKLPKENKIAFLGVLSARKTALEADKKKRFEASSSDSPLGELDQDVFSNIFSFAGPPMLREVSLRVGYNYDIFRKVWYM